VSGRWPQGARNATWLLMTARECTDTDTGHVMAVVVMMARHLQVVVRIAGARLGAVILVLTVYRPWWLLLACPGLYARVPVVTVQPWGTAKTLPIHGTA